MTVESNYTIVIATLCDWLKNLGPMVVESNYTIAIATLCDWLRNLAPMTVESNYTIAIGSLCDWLKNLGPMAVESNYASAIATLWDWLKNLGIARISDWFIALFTPVMIDRRNYFANGFSIVIGQLFTGYWYDYSTTRRKYLLGKKC